MSFENLLVVQCGGPTAVLNTSLAGIVAEALSQPRIGKVFGARGGMMGLAESDLLDLNRLTPDDLARIARSPGAALGSSRFKPAGEDLGRCLETLRSFEIRHLLFLGGNGTMRGAEVVSKYCGSANFDLQVLGVPKTIDNDINGTDRCPGFASAARYVAQSTLDLAADVRSLSQPVSIFETLGRDVGWLAASATVGKQDEDDAPHLVYVPEIPFSTDKFLNDLDSVVSRIGWAVVIVAEGVMYADGTPVYEQRMPSRNGSRNRPLIGGVAQYLTGLAAEDLGIRCRSEKPGLIGRSSMAFVAERDRADAELVGREAVRALIEGHTDKMVALVDLDDAGGRTFDLVPLHLASRSSRAIPAHWLDSGPLAVTDGFRSYAGRLIGELSHYPRLTGIEVMPAGAGR